MGRNTIVATVGLLAIAILGGCQVDPSAYRNLAVTEDYVASDGTDEYLESSAIQPDKGMQAGTAVESALEWASKYAEVAANRDELLRENLELKDADQTRNHKVRALEQQLARAEKELQEANDMLLLMQDELSKWKASIIGYRQEMRDAMSVQLDATRELLSYVKGEFTATPEMAAINRLKGNAK